MVTMPQQRIVSKFVLLILLSLVSPLFGQKSQVTDTLLGNEFFLATRDEIGFIDENLSYRRVLWVSPGDPAIVDTSVSVTPEGIYYIGLSDDSSAYNRFDYATNDGEAVFRHPNLSTATSISTNHGKVLLTLVDIEDPQAFAICVLIFDSSGECREIEINVNFGDFYWLDDQTFVTRTSDEINTYRVNNFGDVAMVGGFQSDSILGAINLLPDGQTVAAVEYDPLTNYSASLIQFDTVENRTEELPQISIPEYGAVIGSLKVSPDDSLLAYKVANLLVITDFFSGETVTQLDNVLSYAWYSEDSILVSQTVDDRWSSPKVSVKTSGVKYLN